MEISKCQTHKILMHFEYFFHILLFILKFKSQYFYKSYTLTNQNLIDIKFKR